ncbi:hypothetical protein [Chroococcidiopsis sp.]|uniref:hypothetical protein n=1 Tax=Chroococcidiopsis sp. TaxID=3088168 RepID=UPI003F349EE1
MIEHPDFFNVRKTAIALAVGPLAFLLLLVGIDFSSHQWQVWQADRSCVKVASSTGVVQLSGNHCSPNQVQYTSQK